MPMPELQPNKITRNKRAGTLLKGAALAGAAAGTLGFAGHANADSHTSKIVNTENSHNLLISNPNTNDTLKIGDVNHEVIGLPKFRTILSKEADASTLSSALGDEISFTVSEGSNVNDEIHQQIKDKTGADLSSEDNWQVVTQVGASVDNVVYPGQVMTYKVNQEAVSTIQNANVEVTVPVTDAVSGENTGTQTSTDSANENATVNCIPTDLKGNVVNFSEDKTDNSNMVSENRALFHFVNLSQDTTHTCPEAVIVRTFESDQKVPNGSGWLESQREVVSNRKEFSVPAGSERNEWIDFTNTGGCTVQIDALKAGNGYTLEEVMELPVDKLSGDVMLDYAFWENPDCIPTATPTFTSTSTATYTPTATGTPAPAECITTDVKGELDDLEDSNHLTGKHVTGVVSNIAQNPDCSDDIYVHMYGSMQKPTGEGSEIGLSIESQKGNHILTQKIDVPLNAVDKPFEIDIPDNKFCTVQVDLTRDGEVKDEPRYIDNDFLLYVNEDICNPKTETPTASATATSTNEATFTPTVTETPVPPTNTPTVTSTGTVQPTNSPESSPTNSPAPTSTPESRVIPSTGDGSSKSKGSNKLMLSMLVMAGFGALALAKGEQLRNNFSRRWAPLPTESAEDTFLRRLSKYNLIDEEDKKNKKVKKS